MTPLRKDDDPGGFDEYRRLILQALEDFRDDVKEINGKLDRMREDITTLKVKASLWGALGGAIVGAIISALAGKWIH